MLKKQLEIFCSVNPGNESDFYLSAVLISISGQLLTKEELKPGEH